MSDEFPFRILIVEDDDLLRSLFVQVLKRQKYQVMGVSSGNEALAAMADQTFELVYSDIRMSDGDGYYLLAELQARKLMPEIFVFVTGHPDVTHQETLNLGAHDVMIKPVETKKLLEYTGQMCQKSLARRKI